MPDAKTQNVRVWNKESFIEREGTSLRRWRTLTLPQIHLKSIPNAIVFSVNGREEGWDRRWVRTVSR